MFKTQEKKPHLYRPLLHCRPLLHGVGDDDWEIGLLEAPDELLDGDLVRVDPLHGVVHVGPREVEPAGVTLLTPHRLGSEL